MKYKSNNNIVYFCKSHVVFCPKYRRKVLNNGVDERLKELINNICQELHVDLIEMKVMPDHVHLLLEVAPQFGIHKVVKRIKWNIFKNTSRRIFMIKIKATNIVTNSYFVSTVGKAPISIIKQYIESQKRRINK